MITADNKYSFDEKEGVLLLSDGTVFYGKSIGIQGTAKGELCFNTGMMGYEEIFTDPSYKQQLLVLTTPHVGNYGFLENDDEAQSNAIQISGLICKNVSDHTSRQVPHSSLKDYFARQNKVILSQIDTRSVVSHIRSKGSMNAIISTETDDLAYLYAELKKQPDMLGSKLAAISSTAEAYYYGNAEAKWKIALIDLGVKKNILRMLAQRDCYIKVFPYHSSFESIMASQPDGVLLSNGPGDPSTLEEVVLMAKKIIAKKIPTFGICLGHQIICTALGLKTYKMHHGHRGVNHPVINLKTQRCEITSQNHGFAVSGKQIEDHPNIEVTHLHLNDDTLAGISLKNAPCFSVQYHPEASPGPSDSKYLFDQFLDLITKNKRETI